MRELEIISARLAEIEKATKPNTFKNVGVWLIGNIFGILLSIFTSSNEVLNVLGKIFPSSGSRSLINTASPVVVRSDNILFYLLGFVCFVLVVYWVIRIFK